MVVAKAARRPRWARCTVTGYAHRLDLERLVLAVRTAGLALSGQLSHETANGTLTGPPQYPLPDQQVAP
jgi:hypothetical protein